MTIYDAWLNPLTGTVTSVLGYREDEEDFPHDIYSLILSSIRDLDIKERKLLYRFVQGMNAEWETIHWDTLNLTDLLSPEYCPEDFLDNLRMNVGITEDLDYIWALLTTPEKRKFIKFFIRFLFTRGSTSGIQSIVTAMLGIDIYVRDYFYHRWLLSDDASVPITSKPGFTSGEITGTNFFVQSGEFDVETKIAGSYQANVIKCVSDGIIALDTSSLDMTEAEGARPNYEFLINKNGTNKTGLDNDVNIFGLYNFPSLTDLSGYGYTASVTGSPISGTDHVSGYYDIPPLGTDSIDFPLTSWPGTTGAVEMMCILRSNYGSGRLLGASGGGANIRTYSTGDGRMHFYVDTTSTTISIAENINFTYNELHHLVLQWEYDGVNTTLKEFIDGVEEANGSGAGSVIAPTTYFRLGKWTTGSDGIIYCAAIHNNTRTEAEWNARYQQFLDQQRLWVMPIASEKADWEDATQDGYSFDSDITEKIEIREISAGVDTSLATTVPAYDLQDSWQNWKFIRDSSDQISVYLNGSLITTLTGSIPVTDTTHSIGKYIVCRMHEDDQIALRLSNNKKAFYSISGTKSSELETSMGYEDEEGLDPYLLSEHDIPMPILPDSVLIVSHLSSSYYKFYIDTFYTTLVDEYGTLPDEIRVCYRPTGVSYIVPIEYDGTNYTVSAPLGEDFDQPGELSTSVDSFYLSYDNDAYVTDIMVEDTALLDKSLLKALLKFSRTSNERFYIRYYSMIDYLTTNDNWNTLSGTVTYDEDDDQITLASMTSNSFIECTKTGSTAWSDSSIAVKAKSLVVSKYMQIRFSYQDSNNYMFINATPNIPTSQYGGTLSLYKVVAGVSSLITTVNLDTFDIDVDYVWKIVFVNEGSNYRIQLYQDEALLLDNVYATPMTWTSVYGNVHIGAEAGGISKVSQVLVCPSPMESDFINIE